MEAHYWGAFVHGENLSQKIFKPWRGRDARGTVNFDQILDVFDCTDAGRNPRHPRIRLLQRESTSNWAAFNEDALIDIDICRPEDPDGDAELGLADDADESNDESLGV